MVCADRRYIHYGADRSIDPHIDWGAENRSRRIQGRCNISFACTFNRIAPIKCANSSDASSILSSIRSTNLRAPAIYGSDFFGCRTKRVGLFDASRAIYTGWSSSGKRHHQNDRGRLFSPRRHPLIPTRVQFALTPVQSSSPRSPRGGIGSMS